jgi:phage shock protein PspC (stress-responsive transcriptional regulator)
MNKTVDINLAGIFFHIDEKAYALLKKYLDALRATFATTEGKDEILADIEARVAELLHERKANKDQVIETEDIEAVIVILGQPEDYVISEDPEPQAATQKKLFRDPDDSYVGGVAAGLAHYFGLDIGWLRIVWAILIFFSGGSFLVIYILFWILIPEAKTTSEKLQMKGEPVNVGTIEKKIREEFNSLADKVKNVDYEQAGSTLKKKSKSFSNNLATLILSLIKIAGKLVGIVLIIFASLCLFGITLGFVTTNVVGWVSEFPLNNIMNFPILKSTPIWLLLILGLCVFGIPMLFLLILGIKLVAPRSNPFGFWGRMILLGVWLLSVIVLVVLGSLEAKSHLFTYQTIDNHNYTIASQDTLQLKALKNSRFQDRFSNSRDFDLIVDENGEKQLLQNNVRLKIETTDRDSLYLSILKEATGPSYNKARANAKKINYQPEHTKNKLLLSTYSTSPIAQKFKSQEVELSLFIPQGQTLFIDSSLLPILGWNIPNDQNYVRRGLAGHHWKMGQDQLVCLDCTPKETQ